MQTRLISMKFLIKATRRSAPYLRALADAEAIDSFVVAGTKWRAFPAHAVEQVRAHEAAKTAKTATKGGGLTPL